MTPLLPILALVATSVACATTVSPSPEIPVSTAVPAPGPAPESAEEFLTAEQIDDLLAPIALYPDPLIAVILPASTFPTDLVLAARFLRDGGDVALVDEQPWDDSIKALARFPEVLFWMDSNLEWTKQLGIVFTLQPAAILNGTQRLRQAALAAGNLVDSPEQRVLVEQEVERVSEPQGGSVVEREVVREVVRIVPAEREIIYVPVYDPILVYRPRPVYIDPVPVITFSYGYPVGWWLSYHCDWYHHSVIVIGRPWRREYWHTHTTWVTPVYRDVHHHHHHRVWAPPPARVEIVRREVHHHYQQRPTPPPVVRPTTPTWQRPAGTPPSLKPDLLRPRPDRRPSATAGNPPPSRPNRGTATAPQRGPGGQRPEAVTRGPGGQRPDVGTRPSRPTQAPAVSTPSSGRTPARNTGARALPTPERRAASREVANAGTPAPQAPSTVAPAPSARPPAATTTTPAPNNRVQRPTPAPATTSTAKPGSRASVTTTPATATRPTPATATRPTPATAARPSPAAATSRAPSTATRAPATATRPSTSIATQPAPATSSRPPSVSRPAPGTAANPRVNPTPATRVAPAPAPVTPKVTAPATQTSRPVGPSGRPSMGRPSSNER